MKVTITGHSSGIGQSLYNKFINENYEVIGYSKDTGCDISTDIGCQQILDQLKSSDIFINNAWHVTGQFNLLKEAVKAWEGTSKKIINISSNIRILPDSFFTEKPLLEYRDSKRLMNDFVNSYSGTINIMNVYPELTKTNFTLDIKEFAVHEGMDPNYVADVIYKEFIVNPNNKDFVILQRQWLNHAI